MCTILLRLELSELPDERRTLLQATCRGGRGRRVRGGTPGGGGEEAFKRGRRRGVLVGL